MGGGNESGSGGGGNGHALLLLGGLVATIAGVILLAPLAIGVLGAGPGPRLPVAIRIALRDLVRYRARSGAALAAATFAVFLAMAICLVGSIRADNPLNPIGPNLSRSQLIFPAAGEPGSRPDGAAQQRPAHQPERAAEHSRRQPARASAVPLESAGQPVPGGHAGHTVCRISPAPSYVATPQLLATYGIKASQIAPGTDILTMRPGLAGLPHLEMIWHSDYGCSHDALPAPARAR